VLADLVETVQEKTRVASEDGRQILRANATGPAADASALGRDLAEQLLAQGAATIAALEPRAESGRS